MSSEYGTDPVVEIAPAKKAPAARKAPVFKPKSAKKKSDTAAASHKRRNYNSYGTFVYKVLRQVHPDTGISKRAMDIMDSFVNDIFERIASEAGRLAHSNKRQTITSREIQTAVRLIMTGDLASYAVSDGTKAVTRYNAGVLSHG